jgi:endonuclease/exonuclease/phosphatase family metal-dependent hydrolase
MTRLDVLTLNIWNKQGDWPSRLPLLKREIENLNADLIGLQEVLEFTTPEGSMNQANEVREASYEMRYAPAQELGPGLHMGNALLSRFPIRKAETVVLPGEDETEERRSLLCALVDHPLGALPTYVTHLNWKLDQGATRIKQVVRIHEEIVARSAPDHLPAILMGDFNAEPLSDEIRFLKGFATLNGQSVHYSDVWDYAQATGSGATFDPRNPYAAQAQEPPRRIDYIFVAGPDTQRRGHTLSAELVANQPNEDGVWPSDHFGVRATISLSQ